ncbi:MAG: hypothetical protein BMS9Abin13_437 [Patescibacteria group bacterium]|nr:MAG: hypothetical protein BMS9Abin13_437 [Patescibacteria group bacterium]
MLSAIYTIIGILLGAIIAGAVAWVAFKKFSDIGEKDELSRKMDILENTFKTVNDMTLKQMLELKRDVTENLKSSRETVDSSSRAMHDHVRDFTASITKMENRVLGVQDLVAAATEKMSSFQDIFKTPKLRGQWGEYNLEYLLEQTYSRERVLRQHYFKDGSAVDFAIKLPNDLLLPIDAKFPMEIFINYTEETDQAEKARKRQVFVSRVKEEISAIATKYIKPQESTTDFALLYIPAEAVYYEIMFGMKEGSLFEYSQKKRVQLVSPNTLNLNLRIIEHWVRDITVHKETKEIVKRLGVVIQDAEKLDESFAKLGKHISHVKSAYGDSEKRLGLLSGRVGKIISLGSEKEEKAVPIASTEQGEDMEK